MADFVDMEGEVFRMGPEVWTGLPEGPVPGGLYTAFLDVARSVNYNALCILRVDERPRVRQVYLDRWTRTGLDDTLRRVRKQVNRYRQVAGWHGCPFGLDQTGTGGGFAQELLRDIRAAGITFTNEWKSAAVVNVENLADHGNLVLLNPDPDVDGVDPTMREHAAVQQAELGDYQGKQLDSGRMKYGGPKDQHDDTVDALLGAAWLAKEDDGTPTYEALEGIM